MVNVMQFRSLSPSPSLSLPLPLSLSPLPPPPHPPPQDALNEYPCGGEHTPSPIASAIPLSATPVLTMNVQLTAVTSANEEGHTIVLLGDKKGQLHKVRPLRNAPPRFPPGQTCLRMRLTGANAQSVAPYRWPI